MARRRRARLSRVVAAGLVVAAIAGAANAGSDSTASGDTPDSEGRNVTVQFQIWDRQDKTSYIFVIGPNGGTIIGYERGPTPGDGLGGVRTLIGTVATSVCNHSKPLCRILTAENEVKVP